MRKWFVKFQMSCCLALDLNCTQHCTFHTFSRFFLQLFKVEKSRSFILMLSQAAFKSQLQDFGCCFVRTLDEYWVNYDFFLIFFADTILFLRYHFYTTFYLWTSPSKRPTSQPTAGRIEKCIVKFLNSEARFRFHISS